MTNEVDYRGYCDQAAGCMQAMCREPRARSTANRAAPRPRFAPIVNSHLHNTYRSKYSPDLLMHTNIDNQQAPALAFHQNYVILREILAKCNEENF